MTQTSIMKTGLLIFGLALLQIPLGTSAQQPGGGKEPVKEIFVIDPSSAPLPGGKARLLVSALKGGPVNYSGLYRMKVTPYFFESETGSVSVTISDESLWKLTQGVAVDFTGHAITSGEKEARVIKIKAKPSSEKQGMLRITVHAKNGDLVFNTTYHFGE
jgi:hypothetical protein